MKQLRAISLPPRCDCLIGAPTDKIHLDEFGVTDIRCAKHDNTLLTEFGTQELIDGTWVER